MVYYWQLGIPCRMAYVLVLVVMYPIWNREMSTQENDSSVGMAFAWGYVEGKASFQSVLGYSCSSESDFNFKS